MKMPLRPTRIGYASGMCLYDHVKDEDCLPGQLEHIEEKISLNSQTSGGRTGKLEEHMRTFYGRPFRGQDAEKAEAL